LCAEVIDHEDLGGEDGLEQLKFGGLNLGVIAVLNALEEFAVIAEEAADAALQDKSLKYTDREVCLAEARGSDKEETVAHSVGWIGLDEFAGDEVRLSERGVCAAKGGLVGVEGTVPVTLGSVGGGETALFALHLLALAGTRDPLALAVDDSNQTDSVADGTCTHLFKGSVFGVESRR
jgi:hypothetical protein